VKYELGCTHYKAIPELKADWLTPMGGKGNGWAVAYFNNLDLEGEPIRTQTAECNRFLWFGQVAPGVDPACFSARLAGTLTVPQSGTYTFSLASAGVSRMWIDGELAIDNWTEYKPRRGFPGMDREAVTAERVLSAGQPYQVAIEYSKQQAPRMGALFIGCLPAQPANLMERAAKVAAGADVALVFIGTGDEWESEGFDRPDMELPGQQVELLEKVAAANPNTVVVLNTGSPIRMRWLDRVAAVVEAWFPGQECGNAIADVLFGDVNPSGRLSQTWPVRLEDNPAFINYPGENGRVLYGEGLFVGYRYYDKKKIEPLFPFGYGLSYTTFEYGDLRLDKAEYAWGETIPVSVDVTNAGSRAGQEVVQLYLRDVESRLVRPNKELKAFAKVALKPGETKTVTLKLDERALSFYDDAQARWVAEAGEFQVLVGASSRDIRCTGTFTLNIP
jgi:beta-glucosidase